MSAAFTLTLAYLGERCSAADTAGAFAAYITGNVGSNLVGRLVSAAVADHYGLAANFYIFAALNLAGALLVFLTISRSRPAAIEGAPRSPLASCVEHFRNPAVLAGFGVGFCILFAFIGTFTYVNFVLVRPPLEPRHDVGRPRLFRVPSFDPSDAGRRRRSRSASARASRSGPASPAPGSGCRSSSRRASSAVLTGMVLVGVGTFFAQAIATGFVSRAATGDRGAASGLYLAFYFGGGLAGSAVLGQVFDRFGWAGVRRRNRRVAWRSRRCSRVKFRFRRRKIGETGMSIEFDAIVIGSGQAGPSLAVRFADCGMKTLLVERERYGGTCVNTGCIPTKTLVASARTAHVARRAGDYGVSTGRSDRRHAGGQGAQGRDRRSVPADLATWLENRANLTIRFGEARFVGTA